MFLSMKLRSDIEKLTSDIAEELKVKRKKFPKTLAFCRSYQETYNLFARIWHKLGRDITEPPGYLILMKSG